MLMLAIHEDRTSRSHILRLVFCFDTSKLAQCLVQIGCSMRQKRDIFAFCTRKGYCKDGYCKFRAGDLSPRGDVRPEVFELTSVKAPDTPCIDKCCPGQTGCVQNASMLALREPSRLYRKQEVLLPPRQYVMTHSVHSIKF
jgi:hypothetical protein